MKLTEGREYYFLYQAPRKDSLFQAISLEGCFALPANPSSMDAVEKGVARDGSTEEPFDFRSQPDYTNPLF